jgi:hypothetical protein
MFIFIVEGSNTSVTYLSSLAWENGESTFPGARERRSFSDLTFAFSLEIESSSEEIRSFSSFSFIRVAASESSCFSVANSFSSSLEFNLSKSRLLLS